MAEPVSDDDSNSPPVALVTGASGFIASHVMSQLLTEGRVRVRGTVRNLRNEAKVAPLYQLVPAARYPLELVEADLLNEGSWKEAIKGCTYVYHIASPTDVTRAESELVPEAVNGTLNILKACAEAGTVRRVVLTSAVSAVSSGLRGNPAHIHTESDWSDEALCDGYERSKLFAERAAWDFVEKLEDEKKFELAVIIPGAAIGPVLTTTPTTSALIVEMILSGKMPLLFNFCFPSVDIRDVAQAHLAAMEKPEAKGQRYILFKKNLWVRDFADIIRSEFEPQGYKIASITAPNALLWVAKFFIPTVNWLYPQLGKVMQYSNEKVQRELGIQLRDLESSVLDACYSLIEKGIVVRKPGYHARVVDEERKDEVLPVEKEKVDLPVESQEMDTVSEDVEMPQQQEIEVIKQQETGNEETGN